MPAPSAVSLETRETAPRMRALVVFSSSELGGAERSLTRMALTDRSGRIDYGLATLDGEGTWTRWVREQGVTPMVLGRRTGGGHGRFGVRAVVGCVRQVRSRRIDVVYVIGLRASLWLRLLKPWLRGAKIAHGVRWNPASRSLLDVAFTGIERWLGGRVDLYICNSRIAADTIATRCRIPRARIHVVHNGLPAVPDGLPRYPDRPPIVLTVAHLAPRKGFLEYLEVVQSVAAADGAARFVFVGRDDMGGAVQEAIRTRGLADRVRCVGYQDDVSPWMRQARLFVLPSLWNEGCPTAILEAKAHAVPIVAYAVDGIPEIVHDGRDGVLVEARHPAALTRAILGLLGDTGRAERMGAEGRASVGAAFSLEACARGHREALSGRPDPTC